uniref:FAD-binding PCMH-type domain-containing protein n=1 Tax=Globodera pallida TaxID=36090 RepID=A0A183C1Q2_GLOPA
MGTHLHIVNFLLLLLLLVLDSSDSTKYESNCDNEKDATIRLHNWGGNFLFCTQNIEYPRTTAEVQQIVRRAKKLRVLGSRHSYNQIADSCDTILSTIGMNSIVALNATAATVTVQPGITYADLAPTLYANNFALANLAALAEVTVAGATQTCSHGSGLSNSNLATHAVACGLGAFGVVTELELNLVPSFDTISYNFIDMPTQKLYEHFDEIHNLGYTDAMMTTLANTSAWTRVTITVVANSSQDQKISNMISLFGASRSFAPSPPLITEVNKVQPWYYGLLTYRLGLSGNDGDGTQSEFFVPYKNGVPALRALFELSPQIQPLISALVIRTVKGDDLWMSMHNGNKPMVAIHFNWLDSKTSVVNPVLSQVEQVLAKFGARPHWGKHFTMDPKQFLKRSYPRLDDFRKLAKQLDPKQKFGNKFLNDNVLAKFGARPHWGKHFTMDPKQFLKRSYPRLDDFRKLAKQLDPKQKFANKFLNDNVFV